MPEPVVIKLMFIVPPEATSMAALLLYIVLIHTQFRCYNSQVYIIVLLIYPKCYQIINFYQKQNRHLVLPKTSFYTCSVCLYGSLFYTPKYDVNTDTKWGIEKIHSEYFHTGIIVRDEVGGIIYTKEHNN